MCVQDICEMFASIEGFSGTGHWKLPIRFSTTDPLPWQRKLGQNWLQLGLCKRYLRDFCVLWLALGMGQRILPIEFFPDWPSLQWERNLGQNGL